MITGAHFDMLRGKHITLWPYTPDIVPDEQLIKLWYGLKEKRRSGKSHLDYLFYMKPLKDRERLRTFLTLFDDDKVTLLAVRGNEICGMVWFSNIRESSANICAWSRKVPPWATDEMLRCAVSWAMAEFGWTLILTESPHRNVHRAADRFGAKLCGSLPNGIRLYSYQGGI